MSSIENKFNEEVTVADIRKELFEDENVVVDKNTDHGLSELTINKSDTDDAANADAANADAANADATEDKTTIDISK